MSLARNTAVIGSLTLVSRVLGFARDIVLAAVLGAGPVADAFFAALRFPSLFRRLFAEGAFSQAFVPVYSKTLAEQGAPAADRLAAEALSLLLLVTGALTAIAILAMPWINRVMFAGYADDPETFALATLLTQLTMPYLVAVSVATLFSGALNARGRFIAAAAAPTLFNLCLLAAVTLFAHTQREAAIAASIAVSVSGVLQAAWVWYGARRSGVAAHLTAPRITPNVMRLLTLAAPAAVAGGALQINIMASQIMASFERGAITYLTVADRLYQLPLGLIGIAVGVAMLPRLSRLVAEDDAVGARAALDEAINLSMAFTLPAAAALLAMPFFLIDGLFSRGQFTSEDARNVATALFFYGFGVPAFVLAKILAPAFFAREDTRAPMRYALVSMAINILLGAALFFGLRAYGLPGFPGLAVATSIAAWVNVALMAGALVRTRALAPSRAAILRFFRLLLAAAIFFVVLLILAAERAWLIGLFGSKEAAIAAVIFAGGIGYFALIFVLRAVTVGEVLGAFRRERGAPAQGALPGGFE